MNDGEKVFEIIQVSFDAKEEDFKKAISGLPWKFLPLNFAGINELKKKYNVLAIPKFFPIDKTGKSLSDRGREDLLEYGVDNIHHLQVFHMVHFLQIHMYKFYLLIQLLLLQ